jgi:CubicO group peptidase (beta-lactamase class C family)
MNRRATAALAAVTIGIVALSTASVAQNDLPLAKPESVGVSSQRLQRVKAFIQDYIDTNQIAGAVTLIARKGKVVHYEAQGWRHKEANQPMQKDTIFTLMSMTKPIVSTALMMLWEDGKFQLDDPIAKFLPNYADKMVRVDGKLVKPERPVTVRHVLTHTSGLSLTDRPPSNTENALGTPEERAAAVAAADPLEGGTANAANAQRQLQQAANTTRQAAGQAPARTLAEAVDRAAGVPLQFHPGDRWQYGDSTDFVAILVEKISGMPIDQFLQKRIFDPLGMRDTHYNVPASKLSRVAAVYRPDPQGKIQLMREPRVGNTTMFRGIAGLNGTAADYFKYSQMLLNGGEYNGQRLLGRMTVNMMFANHIGTGKSVYVRGRGYGFGLGAGVLTDPAQTIDALSPGTWSWGGAYGTIFWIDPVEELIPIMLIQISPYSHFAIRPLFSVVASQAVVDGVDDAAPKIRGYDTPR